MKKIRRWLLLFAALTAIVVRVESLKATSLIFAGKNPTKTTTTTSTTAPEEAAEGETQEEAAEEETKTDNSAETPKHQLTGIPQIDYQWDPNLPRELNGFNLSTYPFLDSVPTEEDIAFTCDDSKKGFYASVKYGCQLYHHCLYGFRSDFICANYTAFDQKTFICHFVSKVDCKNSHKYWNRNDALYIPTTVKPSPTEEPLPSPNPDIYKRKGPGPIANRRRPQRTKRPPPVEEYYYDDDYEDDPYEDRGRRRPQRPRVRRPLYEDDDDEYDRRPYRERERDRVNKRPYNNDYDDDYEYERPRERPRKRTRPGSGSRRNSSSNSNTNDEPIDDRKFDRRPANDRRKYNDDRRSYGDERRSYNNDRRQVEDDRRPYTDERRSYSDRRPVDDKPAYNSDRKPAIDDRKPVVDDRKPAIDDRKPAIDDRKPFNDDRRSDDYDRRPNNDRRRLKNRNNSYDDRRKDYDDEPIEKKPAPVDESKFVKPTGSGASLFDRPRVAPKISRPVPLNERTKFAFKTTEKPKPTPASEEYYDEYEDVPLPPSSTTVASNKNYNKSDRPRGLPSEPKRESNFKGYTDRETSVKPVHDDQEEEYYDDYEKPKSPPVVVPPLKLNRDTQSRPRPFNSNLEDRLSRYKANSEKYTPRLNKDNSQQQVEKQQQSTKAPLPETTTSGHFLKPFVVQKKFANKQTVFEAPTVTTSTTTTTSTPAPVESQNDYDYERERDQRPAVRVIKRPFLPSRGGNPYKARGLQPVGSVAANLNQKSQPELENNEARKPFEEESQVKQFNQDFVNVNSKPKNYYNYQTEENAKTTLEDIYNEDFDVNINDALNPTLRPLSSSPSRIDEYSYDDRPYYSSNYRQPQQSYPEQRISSSENRSSKINLAQYRTTSSTSTTTSSTTTTTVKPESEPEYIYEEYEDYE